MDKYWTKYGAGIGKALLSLADVAERSANCKRVKKVALIGALGNCVACFENHLLHFSSMESILNYVFALALHLKKTYFCNLKFTDK